MRAGRDNSLEKFHVDTGIAIISHGKAEVWMGKHRLLGIDGLIRNQEVVIAPAQAVNPGGRAEIFFSQPGQSVELNIIVDGKSVKQVKIASVTNE